jgi:hypothetical protein
MEPIEDKMRLRRGFKDRVRLIVNLGKYQVTNVDLGDWGTSFILQLPNSVKIKADFPYRADVKVGDILTLYTEVLAHALPGEPPIE